MQQNKKKMYFSMDFKIAWAVNAASECEAKKM